MSKFTAIASLAVVAVGLAISGGSAIAAQPTNQGFGYHRAAYGQAAYDAQTAQGNFGTRPTEQSLRTTAGEQYTSNENTLSSHPNEARYSASFN